jgi:hypothetical protein
LDLVLRLLVDVKIQFLDTVKIPVMLALSAISDVRSVAIIALAIQGQATGNTETFL